MEPGPEGRGAASGTRSLGRGRFEELAAGFETARVVVLGDLMLDRYVSGPADRVSPEAPVPVVRVDREWDAVGGAANVAANVRALGARCDVVGVLGSDAPGEAVAAALERLGAGCRCARDASRATTVKTRVLARGQQVVRIDREDPEPVGLGVAEELAAHIDAVLPGADALVVADYDKGALIPPLIRHTLATAASTSIPVLVDPKRRNFFAYGGATVFKPNRAELEAALGEPVRPDGVDWLGAARERVGCSHLLLTLGAAGMVLASPGRPPYRVAARARSVYDVSGAGDTVAAVVAVALAAGAGLEEAVEVAAVGAAAGVARVGVATVSAEEIALRLADEAPGIPRRGASIGGAPSPGADPASPGPKTPNRTG
ncbi:MAG: PfkB family carbohydrate kinase [Gemmatimonadota bacterium]|nr:PfkB family carbohydrate kinase [Gemmatimonadota bacterium]